MPARPARSTPRPRPLAALLAALVVAAALPAAAAEDEAPPPSISVTGNGQVRRQPDEASVHLGVTFQAEQAGAAQQQVNRVAGAIVDAVTALGVPRDALQTSRLVLEPVYSNPTPDARGIRRPEVVGYRASNVVSVRLDDLARVGPVIDAALGAGANEVQGVDFRLRDDRPARQEALREAVLEARAKAEAIAGALGVTLGPVLHADEGNVQIAYPRFAPTLQMARAEASAPTPVEAGEITVDATVGVTFRITPR